MKTHRNEQHEFKNHIQAGEINLFIVPFLIQYVNLAIWKFKKFDKCLKQLRTLVSKLELSNIFKTVAAIFMSKINRSLS